LSIYNTGDTEGQTGNVIDHKFELFSELEVPVKIEYIQHIPLGGDILLGGKISAGQKFYD